MIVGLTSLRPGAIALERLLFLPESEKTFMLMQRTKRTLCGLLLLLAISSPAWAGVEQIVSEFKPVPAYIVMEMDGEYLVDKDAAQGIRVGDIFAAVTAGEKIIHPVTGEVLGSLDKVRAQLRVTKVKSGYSYAAPLPGSSKLKPGEAIVRFQGLPAALWDYTGEGESLQTALQSGLPALEWTDYSAAQALKPSAPQKVNGLEGLVFVLTGKGLEVRDASFQPVRFYSRTDLAKDGIAIATASQAMPVSAPVAMVPSGIVAAPVSDTGTAGIVKQEGLNEGVWFGPEMTGEIVGIEVDDFDGDGRSEIVTVFPNKVLVGSFTGSSYQGEGFIDLPNRLRLIGVDSADLDGNGRPELYISALEPNTSDGNSENVASIVAEWIDGQFKIIADDIPYILGRADTPSAERVILAQRAESQERTYSGKVYFLKREGKKFKAKEELPVDYDKLTVHGFTFFKANSMELLALFDINEKLEIVDNDGNLMWGNGEVLGGSQTYIVSQGPTVRADMPSHQFFKARLATLHGDTVLVPLNEGSSRMFYKREFNKSKLLAMQWDGYAMKEVWHTEPQGGYLADFRVADVDNDGKEEIVMGILFNQGGMANSVQKRSALVVYEVP